MCMELVYRDDFDFGLVCGLVCYVTIKLSFWLYNYQLPYVMFVFGPTYFTSFS